jgi:hypothetical protein
MKPITEVLNSGFWASSRIAHNIPVRAAWSSVSIPYMRLGPFSISILEDSDLTLFLFEANWEDELELLLMVVVGCHRENSHFRLQGQVFLISAYRRE